MYKDHKLGGGTRAHKVHKLGCGTISHEVHKGCWQVGGKTGGDVPWLMWLGLLVEAVSCVCLVRTPNQLSPSQSIFLSKYKYSLVKISHWSLVTGGYAARFLGPQH